MFVPVQYQAFCKTHLTYTSNSPGSVRILKGRVVGFRRTSPQPPKGTSDQTNSSVFLGRSRDCLGRLLLEEAWVTSPAEELAAVFLGLAAATGPAREVRKVPGRGPQLARMPEATTGSQLNRGSTGIVWNIVLPCLGSFMFTQTLVLQRPGDMSVLQKCSYMGKACSCRAGVLEEFGCGSRISD